MNCKLTSMQDVMSDNGAFEWTLGDRIVKARKVARLSQSELADLAGVDRRTVASAEQDRRMPIGNNLSAIAAALGVSMAWLLGESPHPLAEASGARKSPPSGDRGQVVRHQGLEPRTR